MESRLKTAPWWFDLSAALVRRLPAGRYVAMRNLCRYPVPPFLARLLGSRSGLKFECDVRNELAREAYFMGHYEPQETCLLHTLLGPGDTFVDVGANWGYFSLLATERVGASGRVVSVEADPRMFSILQRNVAMNALPQVTLVPAAAAAGPGTLKLAGFDEEQSNWGISRVVSGGGGKVFEVPAKAVDDLADELGLGSVDLLKMDIEGAEVFALAGMERGLASHRYKRILLELHPVQLAEHGTTADAVCARLIQAGYTGWRVRHSREDTRRAAYARSLTAADVLVPARPGEPLDEWPHVLWMAPGVPAPWAASA
ncbi:MAG TPA: FkbM family methyltransferase [Myxococcaceae bacterium]|nr:FkbM family methyltransferase [Myxococcaceae bacterium]